jgi:hypothetical protein
MPFRNPQMYMRMFVLSDSVDDAYADVSRSGVRVSRYYLMCSARVNVFTGLHISHV